MWWGGGGSFSRGGRLVDAPAWDRILSGLACPATNVIECTQEIIVTGNEHGILFVADAHVNFWIFRLVSRPEVIRQARAGGGETFGYSPLAFL